MDPVSRRRLWQEIINLTRQKNHSVLLTSHSMEECEVLCTRLAMMCDGKFKCMGSVQHLKTKFGDGYTLTIKIKESANRKASAQFNINSFTNKLIADLGDDNEEEEESQDCIGSNKYINLILSEMQQKISSKCKLKERHFNNVFQFELPYPKQGSEASFDFCIGDIYRLIELNKLRFNIADYSLSQNTLDNVFINFVKEQTSKKRKTTLSCTKSDDEYDDDDELIGGELNFSNTSNVQFPIHDTTDLLLDNTQDRIHAATCMASSQNLHPNANVSLFRISKNSGTLNDSVNVEENSLKENEIESSHVSS